MTNKPADPPINPYLEDVIRTALEENRTERGSESAEPKIVIFNHGHVVAAPGGVITVIHNCSPTKKDT